MIIPSNQGNLGNNYFGGIYGAANQAVQPQPVPTPQPVYPTTFSGSQQQYGTAQPEVYRAGFIVVHDENEAMDNKYPLNTPLFNDMEDVFYFKQLGPDNMHTIVKKARFVWEDDGVIDVTTPLIEQKDMTYGDSPKSEELEGLKKSIEDLAGQVSTLVELQLEQQTAPDKDKAKSSSNSRKTSQNK